MAKVNSKNVEENNKKVLIKKVSKSTVRTMHHRT